MARQEITSNWQSLAMLGWIHGNEIREFGIRIPVSMTANSILRAQQHNNLFIAGNLRYRSFTTRMSLEVYNSGLVPQNIASD